jgi:hypothetical protein
MDRHLDVLHQLSIKDRNRLLRYLQKVVEMRMSYATNRESHFFL